MQQTQVLQQTRLMQWQRTPCVWCALQTRLLHFTHDKRACCVFSMRTTQKTQLLRSTCSKHNQHAKNAFHVCEPQMRLCPQNFIVPNTAKYFAPDITQSLGKKTQAGEGGKGATGDGGKTTINAGEHDNHR
jgi:hypothetical protein